MQCKEVREIRDSVVNVRKAEAGSGTRSMRDGVVRLAESDEALDAEPEGVCRICGDREDHCA